MDTTKLQEQEIIRLNEKLKELEAEAEKRKNTEETLLQKNTLLEAELKEEKKVSKQCLQRYMKLIVEHNLLN